MKSRRRIETAEGRAIGKFLTIDGLVIPVKWDEEGNASEITIATLDEDEYLVLLDEKGQELLKHLKEEVLIKGWFYRDDSNRKCIAVESYSL